MRNRLGCLVAVLAVATTACTAMRVTGVVRDRDSKQPIVGAVVGIDGRALVTSHFSGRHSLKAPAKASTLMASAPSCVRMAMQVAPVPDRYLVQDIELERSPDCGGARQAER